MPQVKFLKGKTREGLSKVPLTHGSIYFVEENRRLYIDTETRRLPIAGDSTCGKIFWVKVSAGKWNIDDPKRPEQLVTTYYDNKGDLTAYDLTDILNWDSILFIGNTTYNAMGVSAYPNALVANSSDEASILFGIFPQTDANFNLKDIEVPTEDLWIQVFTPNPNHSVYEEITDVISTVFTTREELNPSLWSMETIDDQKYFVYTLQYNYMDFTRLPYMIGLTDDSLENLGDFSQIGFVTESYNPDTGVGTLKLYYPKKGEQDSMLFFIGIDLFVVIAPEGTDVDFNSGRTILEERFFDKTALNADVTGNWLHPEVWDWEKPANSNYKVEIKDDALCYSTTGAGERRAVVDLKATNSSDYCKVIFSFNMENGSDQGDFKKGHGIFLVDDNDKRILSITLPNTKWGNQNLVLNRPNMSDDDQNGIQLTHCIVESQKFSGWYTFEANLNFVDHTFEYRIINRDTGAELDTGIAQMLSNDCKKLKHIYFALNKVYTGNPSYIYFDSFKMVEPVSNPLGDWVTLSVGPQSIPSNHKITLHTNGYLREVTLNKPVKHPNYPQPEERQFLGYKTSTAETDNLSSTLDYSAINGISYEGNGTFTFSFDEDKTNIDTGFEMKLVQLNELADIYDVTLFGTESETPNVRDNERWAEKTDINAHGEEKTYYTQIWPKTERDSFMLDLIHTPIIYPLDGYSHDFRSLIETKLYQGKIYFYSDKELKRDMKIRVIDFH